MLFTGWKLSVGLVWASNPGNKAMYRNKNISLERLMPCLAPSLNLRLIELHCLQFGEDGDQLNPWRNMDGITDWKNKLDDFPDGPCSAAAGSCHQHYTAVAHLQEPCMNNSCCHTTLTFVGFVIRMITLVQIHATLPADCSQ